MKKLMTGFAFLVVIASAAYGVSFNDFLLVVNQKDTILNAFAKDVGSLLGGGFINGNNPGLLGLDVSGKFVLLDKPTAADVILPANTLLGLPYAQVEAGLPLDLSVVVRGMTLPIDTNSVVLFGGGVKYKLLKDSMALPGLAVLATYSSISGVPSFDASAFSLNIALSKSLSPVPLTVFVYGGMDITSVSSKVPGFTTLKGNDTSYRVNAGARFSPFPLVYVEADMGFFATNTNYNLAAGISF